MSRVVMHLSNHGNRFTVREMRRRLASLLSKLDGDQEVIFDFQAVLENYRTIPTISDSTPNVYYGPLARPEND